MFQKDWCRTFFERTLGLKLTDDELNGVLNHLEQNKLTPISEHGGNTIGFTPAMLCRFISLAKERMGCGAEDRRLKKVNEEIMPAVFLALLLRRIGQGEYIIVSADVPDIMFIDFEQTKINKPKRRTAVPIEAIFIPKYLLPRSANESAAERLANAIIAKKFIGYAPVPETILLATLSAELEDIRFTELSYMLSRRDDNPFHQIWMFAGLMTGECLIIRLCPTLEIHRLHVERDLLPMMY